MLKFVFAAAFVVALTACSSAQVASGVSKAQTDTASLQTSLNAACATIAAVEGTANAFGASVIPQATVIEGYAAGACLAGQATAAIVSAAVNDPTTVAWVENLATELAALKNVKA